MIQKIFKYILPIFCLLLAFPPGQKIEAASPSALTEEQVKSAYIYNFAKFVQWPESAFSDAKAPLHICISAPEALYLAMESLKDKTVQGRPLKIAQHSRNMKAHKCHVLFIARENKKDAWEKREKHIIPHVLTIADFDSFVSQGGIIELISEGSKIRFAVNINAANRAELKLSSKLLNLAKFVKE
jgi:YfiR/HmsC-like